MAYAVRQYLLWLLAFAAGAGILHINRFVHNNEKQETKQKIAIAGSREERQSLADAWGINPEAPLPLPREIKPERPAAAPAQPIAPAVAPERNDNINAQRAAAQPPLDSIRGDSPPSRKQRAPTPPPLHRGSSTSKESQDGTYFAPPGVSAADAVARKAADIAAMMEADASTGGYIPVTLDLHLGEWQSEAFFGDRKALYKQYGFNLDVSNKHDLATAQADIRSDECKALPLPPIHRMPKVSVIIIFFNEPMSTLLRNVVSVLNRSPPQMLGEVLLVDDYSSLPQLALLEEHLDRLPLQARRKVRLFKRTPRAKTRPPMDHAPPSAGHIQFHTPKCTAPLYIVHDA